MWLPLSRCCCCCQLLLLLLLLSLREVVYQQLIAVLPPSPLHCAAPEAQEGLTVRFDQQHYIQMHDGPARGLQRRDPR